eukprot:1215631-Amphidinium_carterae.1
MDQSAIRFCSSMHYVREPAIAGALVFCVCCGHFKLLHTEGHVGIALPALRALVGNVGTRRDKECLGCLNSSAQDLPHKAFVTIRVGRLASFITREQPSSMLLLSCCTTLLQADADVRMPRMCRVRVDAA